MQQRRNRAVALLAGSLAVLVVVPTAWALSQPDDVGRQPARPPQRLPDLPRPPPSPRGVHAPAPAAPQVAGAEVPRIGVEVAPQPDLPLPPLPTQLLIPSVRINATVAPTGVLADGQVDVPKDARAVGWYEYGVRPGWPVGSSVIVGHVDSRTQGRGAMFTLKGVQVGDPVSVVREDGSRSGVPGRLPREHRQGRAAHRRALLVRRARAAHPHHLRRRVHPVGGRLPGERRRDGGAGMSTQTLTRPLRGGAESPTGR